MQSALPLETGGPLTFINAQTPIAKVHSFPKENGPVVGIAISSHKTDNSLLATFTFSGTIKIFNLRDYSYVCSLRDYEEVQIEECFAGTFLCNDTLLAVGGKLKNRHKWSKEDDDNCIMPCPIKIYDIVSGKVVCRLDGHQEEILSIRAVTYCNANYLLSTSQDGYIIRWSMDSDWRYIDGGIVKFKDDISGMVFKTALFKMEKKLYVLAACDEGIRLFDFESGEIVKRFEDNSYSSYCDDLCFVDSRFCDWTDESDSSSTQINQNSNIKNDTVLNEKRSDDRSEENFDNNSSSLQESGQIHTSNSLFSGLQQCAENEFYVVGRGVELVQPDSVSLPIHPNSVTLHKLSLVTEIDPRGIESDSSGTAAKDWKLETLFKYSHPFYTSNSWYIKIDTNGRYVFAPTSDGKVFIFALGSGQVSGVLSDHEEMEVRQVLLHPSQPMLFTCGDDGNVFVYSYFK